MKKVINGFGMGILALLLCVAMLWAFPSAAWAADTQAKNETEADAEAAAAAAAEAADTGFLDSAELTKMTESFLGQRGISTKGFSLGFTYTATGDTWYFNPDQWFYPGSVYKVPLMMLLSEKVKSGELSQDSVIKGLSVAEIERYILVDSNNDWAHTIRDYLGGDEVWRQEVKKYASLKDTDYDPDYMDYCYFSNRYANQVMNTLFASPDSYPNIIDCLKAAEPEHYFRLKLEGKYEIAQKYGSYNDQLGDNWNTASGIIYTPNPIIVTVFTLNVDNYEEVIGDAAKMLTDYALELDGKLGAYQRQQAQEEAERLAAEQAQAEAEAKAKAEAEKAAAEKLASEKAIAEQQALQAARKELFTKLLILVGIIAAVGVTVLLVVRSRRNKQRAARYEAYRRRYEAEQRSTETRPRSGGSGGYRPRH